VFLHGPTDTQTHEHRTNNIRFAQYGWRQVKAKQIVGKICETKMMGYVATKTC